MQNVYLKQLMLTLTSQFKYNVYYVSYNIQFIIHILIFTYILIAHYNTDMGVLVYIYMYGRFSSKSQLRFMTDFL